MQFPEVFADSVEVYSTPPSVDGFVFSSRQHLGPDAFVLQYGAGREDNGGMTPPEYSSERSDWMVLLVMLLLLLVIRSRVVYFRYFNALLKSLVNRTASIKLLEEKNILFHNMAWLLLPASISIMAVFITYTVAHFFSPELFSSHFLLSLGLVFFGLTIFQGYRMLLHKLMGSLFYIKELAREYGFNQQIYVMGYGVFLFPFVILLPFVPLWLFNSLVIIVLALTLAFILLALVRSFRIIFDHRVPFFYLILYICSLEVLPVALLLKAIHSNI